MRQCLALRLVCMPFVSYSDKLRNSAEPREARQRAKSGEMRYHPASQPVCPHFLPCGGVPGRRPLTIKGVCVCMLCDVVCK